MTTQLTVLIKRMARVIGNLSSRRGQIQSQEDCESMRRITARVPGGLDRALGEVLHFAIRPEQVHLFDAQSGSRI